MEKSNIKNYKTNQDLTKSTKRKEKGPKKGDKSGTPQKRFIKVPINWVTVSSSKNEGSAEEDSSNCTGL